MQDRGIPELVPLDPEIERTLRDIRRAKRTGVSNMGEQPEERAIRDHYRPVVSDNYSGITQPAINANNFELKPALINMVQQNQFGGSPTEDPNVHLAIFREISDTIKMNGVSTDAIRLRLFPFSLRDKARSWLQSLQAGSITTWDEMVERFLAKFFPPAKTAQLRSEIGQFRQLDFEPLYESWERFKDLVRRCPQHGFPDWLQIQLFYNGLNGQTRTIVDATSGGSLMGKTAAEAYTLLEEMASNTFSWPNERNMGRKVAGIIDVDPITALTAQMSSLTHQLAVANATSKGLPSQEEPSSSNWGSIADHAREEVQYINNRGFGNNFRPNFPGNQYQTSWRNQEPYGNFRSNANYQASSQHPPPGFQPPQAEKKPSLEELLSSFISEGRLRFKKNESRMDNIETHMSNMNASIKTMET